jgi:hypothetical protein
MPRSVSSPSTISVADMSNRLSVILALLAAVALAVAPLRSLFHGISPLIGLLRVALVLLAAWGLARRAAWGRWLLTVMAVLSLWAAVRTWLLPVQLRQMIPYFAVWRAGRVLGAVLLIGATVAAWEAVRKGRTSGTAVEGV